MKQKKNTYLIALAGNPNTGKTSIFNALTGLKQKVGNWPGVTVEKKEGEFEYKGYKFKIVDLPGTYSLSSQSIDEKIARDFILKENPDVIIVVVDETNLERSLNLVLQLLEMRKKLLLAFNMSDIAKKLGFKINLKCLKKILKVEIVETVAHKGEGIDLLKEKLIEVLEKENSLPKLPVYRGLENYCSKVKKILKNNLTLFEILKILEEDEEFLRKLKNEELKKVKSVLKCIKEREREEPFLFVAKKRYSYIKGILKECVKKKKTFEDELRITDAIDKVVLHPFWGLIIFLALMYIVFKMVFSLGNPFSEFLSDVIDKFSVVVSTFLLNLGVSEFLVSFIREGIFGGVGAIVVFLPNIFILYLIFGIFEDSGYMARVAFVVDRFMHKIGLHGKSFIPLVLAFGCNVPAIMATRTIENERDRIITILMIPFISCSARLPVYLLFARIFFPGRETLIVFSLYLTGIVIAILVALFLRKVVFRGGLSDLIMDLPLYKFPYYKNVLQYAFLRTKAFLQKAGSIIFLASIFIWLLASLPYGVKYASDSSLIGKMGKIISPLLKPAGFGYWQIAVALIMGVVAKEVVVSTLGTLFGSGESLNFALRNMFNSLSAYSFLLMSLIYTPCIATLGVIKKEAGIKWMVFSLFISILIGWLIATLFYQIANFLV